MKVNLLKGSFNYGAVTVISRVASVILIPILARLLSPVEYGTLNMTLTIVIITNLVAGLEVSQAVTFFFTDRSRPDRDLYPSTAIRFLMGMYLFFFVLAALFGEIIFKLISGDTIGVSLLIDGAFLLAANGIFLFLQNQLRLEFKSRGYAILTLGYVLLTCFGAIGGALYAGRPAEGVIFGQAVGAAIIDIIGVAVLWKRFSSGFNITKLRQMLKLSLPLVPAGLLLIGGQQVPKFILGIYGSLEDVGIYGLAYQIAGFSALAVLGVQTAITPSVLANHKEPETPKMLATLFEAFVLVVLLFCSFLSIFSHELVLIFSTASYGQAANFIPLLAFAIVLNNLYIFFPGKIITGKSASQLIASAGCFLVAVIAGFILVKIDGIRGATVATLLSAIAFFFIWCYISQKLYRLPVNWLKLFIITLLTIIVCCIGIFLIPAGITFNIVVIKSGLLLLFACTIAWNYIARWGKHFFSWS
ncbi:MAG: oligosaccharide flippase family protein [Ferruginibacter sp.]